MRYQTRDDNDLIVFISDVLGEYPYIPIIESLVARGFRITVVLVEPQTYGLEEACESIGVHQVIPLPPRKFSALTRVIRVIINARAQGIVCFGQQSALVSLAPARFLGTPVRILRRGHAGSNHVDRHPKGRVFDRLTTTMSTHIITNSKNSAAWLNEKEGIQKEKISYVWTAPRPLDISEERREATRGRLGLEMDDIIIGIAARPIPLKGIAWSLRELITLMGDRPNLKVVIGNWRGKIQPDLQSLVTQAGPSRVKTVPFFSEMSDFYSAIDVHVHTPVSRYAEGFGNVFAEGLVSGKPCVYTYSGFICDLENKELEGVTFVNFGDSRHFVSAIDDAIKLSGIAPFVRPIPGLQVHEMIRNYTTVISTQMGFSSEKGGCAIDS